MPNRLRSEISHGCHTSDTFGGKKKKELTFSLCKAQNGEVKSRNSLQTHLYTRQSRINKVHTFISNFLGLLTSEPRLVKFVVQKLDVFICSPGEQLGYGTCSPMKCGARSSWTRCLQNCSTSLNQSDYSGLDVSCWSVHVSCDMRQFCYMLLQLLLTENSQSCERR